VGTKLKLAIDHDRHDTVGQDLVAMCVNDVLVTGAEPFLFLDYYATAALDVDVAERVINGIARGCELAGCALVGGETAEMPGFYQPGDYDLAGFCVGVVERSRIIDGSSLAVGDMLVGLPSSGPHSNGYSLIRRLLTEQSVTVDGALLDALMAPTRIYAKAVLELLEHHPVHAMAHITGGGILENLPRIFAGESGQGLAALVDLDAWSRPDVFNWMQQAGNIDEDEMLRTFNCGIGFVIVVPEDAAGDAMATLSDLGEAPVDIGRIVTADTVPGPGERLVD
ncbi:phosphoribosylformylglycinamidine cyclo-ligase, partial [Limnoraphis robusta CCNP1324]|uniref:phosphoribosylformylglycinamidine cyclo-ligase n=1 Tax=Limnoraphis robusta TaxID=1118279 RepID=UPI002B1F90A1